METLIFSLKFFLKIITVVVSTYLSSDNTNTIFNKAENIIIESNRIEITDLNPVQDTPILDSLNLSKITLSKNNEGNYEFKEKS